MCDFLQKEIADFYHSLLRDTSKRTSEELSNAVEVPDPNSAEGGGDDTEVSEHSESADATSDTSASGGDEFMHTDDFGRLFAGFVMVDTSVAMR